MNRFLSSFTQGLKIFSGVIALAALILPTYQILAQIFYPAGMKSWIYEVFIYLLVWACLLTASTLTAEGRHIRVDSIFAVVKGATVRRIELFNTVVSLVFSAVILWYGFRITYDAWDIGERSVTSLQFPMWIYYAALPTSFFLTTVFYVIRLVRLSLGYHVPGLGTDQDAPLVEGAQL